MEVFKRLRPGEPVTIESAQQQLDNLFFDPHRYDISRVGRYKYNKKLAISGRLAGCKLAQPVVAPLTGEILAEAGELVTKAKAQEIERAGVMTAVADVDGKEVKIISNGMVDALDYVPEGITRDELLKKIWGYDFSGESRTVDVHIRTLRSKLGNCGDVIQTIRGVGYKAGEKSDDA